MNSLRRRTRLIFLAAVLSTFTAWVCLSRTLLVIPNRASGSEKTVRKLSELAVSHIHSDAGGVAGRGVHSRAFLEVEDTTGEARGLHTADSASLTLRQPTLSLSRSEARAAAGTPSRFPPDLPFLDALSQCDTLPCVRDAHLQPRNGARFNFPHFIITGFQKAATTSLYAHLAEHPEVRSSGVSERWKFSSAKEPNFFSEDCKADPTSCPAKATHAYLQDVLKQKAFIRSKGRTAHNEASTHYVRTFQLAAPLHEMMPWLKVIVNLREPISRAISMLVHNEDKNDVGCLALRGRNQLGTCLLRSSQVQQWRRPEQPNNYTEPMMHWLEAYPRDKLHIIQYEELISEEGEDAELQRVKAFLGIDPEAGPKDLGLKNSRKFRIRPDGWRIPRAQYQQLVDRARKDSQELVALLAKHGYLSDGGVAWMQRWEQVWQDNLATCDASGICKIQLS